MSLPESDPFQEASDRFRRALRIHQPDDWPTAPYTWARMRIESGDVVAFRRTGLISRHSGSKYTHVGLAVWRNADQNSLLLAESREFVGGRVVSLGSQVRQYPGSIDVFRPIYQCPTAVRERAATLALNWSGKNYGWRQALRMTLLHMPLARRAGEWYHGRAYDPTDMTPSGFDEAKVCSTLVAWAYRRAIVELGTAVDWDPVPGRGDNWIEPAHLVQSGSFRRVFRAIVPDGHGFGDELASKE